MEIIDFALMVNSALLFLCTVFLFFMSYRPKQAICHMMKNNSDKEDSSNLSLYEYTIIATAGFEGVKMLFRHTAIIAAFNIFCIIMSTN